MNAIAPIECQCCIAGGGPAGMMAGYLFARAGIRTVVLEKHADFLRDFRGDTVHPSTLSIMEELGLLDQFLKLPHQRLDRLEGWFGTRRIRIADLRRVHTRHRFIAMMPQWDFLNFIAAQAREFATFGLMMRTEATDLLRVRCEIAGLRAATAEGEIEIRSSLTIAADGRHSVLRAKAGLAHQDVGAPIDALWFRLPRDPASSNETFGHIRNGRILITIDRGDYWQCAFVIAKGGIERIKSRGLEAFRSEIAATAPILKGVVGTLAGWDDIKLLTVTVDRLREWSRPGLLCIGDAAHAMSPVGGVGINLAIQDAVAAANILSRRFDGGGPSPDALAAVQRRREWPVRLVQAFQVQAHERILAPVLSSEDRVLEPPLPLRLLSHSAFLRGLLARFVGLGVRQEHVRGVKRVA